MVVGSYHGLNRPLGLPTALPGLHWDACVVILSNIELSHMLAGHLWALKPGLWDLRYFNYLCVVSIVSFYLLPDFSLVPMVGGLVGTSQRTGRLNCVTDRCEQVGQWQKKGGWS